MKLKIEIDENLTEPEVVIRCARADEEVLSIQRRVLEHSDQPSRLVLYRDGVEYYLPAEHILFFETQDEQVYAHTARDVYRIKRRLYELERELPRVFVRVSKSAIVNTARIYSVTRDFTGFSSVSQAHFRDTQKTIYISRRYAATLRDALGAY